MEERIKLIWDFRGPDAKKIAEHHVIHLNEYAEANDLENPFSGVVTSNEALSYAYLVVNKDVMKIVRDQLKPHRGQIYSTK